MSDKYHNVIGIDLGTTYSAVAANNKYVDSTEVFKTSKGERTIPSVVSFDRSNKKAYAGQEAKNNYPIDPDNTVIEIKREMGEVVNEQNIGKLRKLGLNPVINEDPYRVFFGDNWYLPQEISAFILMEAKEIAQKEINEVINDAVITVPAYFTEKQKKATEEAALLAGLYPRQLIPEPTAAAICYGVDTRPSGKMKYLVYDLGGGTFDVSIIEVENTLISVIATSGDRRLGGSDFDNEITSWILKKLLADYQLDISNNQFFVAKIKASAEEAKKILSQFDDASIDLSFLNDPRVNNIKITRSDFEKLIDHLLHKSLNKVDEAIQVANMSKDNIDFILLVGGSTKIPKVRRLLLEYFGKGDDFVSADADPDTAVARGAAIMAKKFEATPGKFDIEKRAQANLMSKDTEGIPDTTLITEHSLGIGTVRDLVVHIIERGRVLPARQSKDDFVNSGPSEYIYVPVFQGESKYAYENTLIGTLPIGPMEPRPAGEHRFEVIFNIDQNGLLAMTINHLNENKSYNAEFIQKTGIGGDEKLKIVRVKLADMFRHKEDGRFVPASYTETTAVEKTYATESYDNVVPPPVAPESNVMGRSTDIETVPFEEVIHESQEPEMQVVTEKLQVTEIPGLLQSEKPIPAEFAEVVSSASEMHKTLPEKELTDAYNKFILSINQGKGEDEMETAGDELADIIDKLGMMYENGLLKAKKPIPGQFEELISKCRESWDKTKDRNLRNAFNDFVSAVNKGKSEEELIDQGDTLGEIFESLSRATGESEKDKLLEPFIEVPDKYKMLVRRSKKQLLLNPGPELFKSYNSFIKGLNDNLGETEILKLNEQLNKAFLETK